MDKSEWAVRVVLMVVMAGLGYGGFVAIKSSASPRKVVPVVSIKSAVQESGALESSQNDEAVSKIKRPNGTWIYQTGLGNCVIRLREDGTGLLDETKFQWESNGNEGFSGVVNFNSGYGEAKPRKIFGHITPNGDLFTNYEPMFGTFGESEQTIFKKVE